MRVVSGSGLLWDYWIRTLHPSLFRPKNRGLMMPSSIRGWSMAVAVSMAAALTLWTIAVVASDLTREDSYPPWALYILWFLLLAMVWSALSLLRWRTNLAIVVLLLSSIYALPLGVLIVLLRSVSD
jgi:hypothetical protein